LDCPELIDEFEAKLAGTNSPKRKLEHDTSNKKKKIIDSQVRQLKKFFYGLIPDNEHKKFKGLGLGFQFLWYLGLSILFSLANF
jgi:hypothetical protein